MATGATGYGVTPQGFYPKPLATTQAEIDRGMKGILGESAGTEPDGTIPHQTMAGQLKALLVDGFAAQWDLQQAVYDSVDPNKNGGASQDAIAAITGAVRAGARYSVATGICVGDPLTLLEAGRVADVPTTGARFASLADATLVAGTAWVALATYAVGDIVVNSTDPQRVYRCITGGIAAGAGGPTTQANDITDGTVHWQYLGDGSGWIGVPFQAEVTGAIGAIAGHMTGIATPVSGWNAVHNPFDAALGNAREVDSAFRLRRQLELAAAGNTTQDAIRANLLAVNAGSSDANHTPPVACLVLANFTDYTNDEGVPPRSIECVVQGGTAQDIAQAIWDSIGGGTATYGSTTTAVVDSEGNTQYVRWSRPTEVPVYVTGTGKYLANDWPAGSDALVAQAMLSSLLTYAATYPIARDVRTGPLQAAMLRGPSETDDNGDAVVPATPSADPVPGLLEIDPLYISTAPGPTTTTQIPISRREIATFDSSRCVLTASAETE